MSQFDRRRFFKSSTVVGAATIHSPTQTSLLMKTLIVLFVALLLSSDCVHAQVVRERDVIYLRSEGVALTMDVFAPEKPNGVGIIKIVSGGWKSSHSKIKEGFSSPYTDHGYTVFAVVHGSQPRYQVRDIMEFMHRAVRFIRTNAARWDIDPDRIGVTGSSAGGHLSLVLATKGGPGDPKAKDPVERASSAVQAACVFYPPTDYLNWSGPGDDCVGVGKQERWQPAFGNESKTAETRQVLGRHMSSIYHICENTSPISIIHGDADPIVPMYQSQSFKSVAESKGVPIELVIKEGAKHGWPNKEADELDDRDLAAKVSPHIVLLAFFGKADTNGKPDLIETVIEKLKRVAPLADRHGFILALETQLNEADHRHILESVGSPAVKIYYDTGNASRMGYDIYREIESLGSENICEIHLKENGDLLGKGDIDFARVKTLLESMQYKGWLIIEGSFPKGMSRTEATEKNATYALELFTSSLELSEAD